ncbi:response regulator [Bacteroides sp. 51]|uniref:hybrid sensor histidine kinase/response regulator transcription factor n=1 Tax=Bacteroides sp. 51 TaxID=2302938 RepID=UPI0013CF9C21|nr:response regulator [Bacteroides sp. 51]NDV83228.1 hybrid sensor histidine kinase/response regulator [Bacteroides sp. 51]
MSRILSIICLLFMLSASASSTSFRHIGVKDGLSSRQVFRLTKDSSGFIWAFTYLGVDRYDGNEIRHYKLDKTLEARDHIISSTIMTCDQAGTVWISLKSGKLYRYDKQTDAFNLEADFTQLLSKAVALNDIYFDKDNNLWLCLSTGIYHYTPETKSLTQAGMPGEQVNRIIQLYDGSYVAGTGKHLYRLWKEENANTFSTTKRLDFPIETRTESLFTIDQKLFVGTFSDGAFMIDIPSEKTTSFQSFIPSVPIRAFASTTDQTVLVGTDGSGVYQVDTANGQLINRYLADEDNDSSLGGNTVSDIFVDERHCIWVSTYTNGISYLDPNSPETHWVRHGHNNRNSLISSHINVMLEDSDGDFWYGTNDGISLYQPATNQWTHFLDDKKDNAGHSFVVLALCEDTRKNIWVGGYGIGIFRINKQSRRVERIKTGSNGIATDYVYAIHQDGDRLYFGGIEGDFTCLDTQANTYTYYPIDCIGDIKPNDDHTLLMAGCGGLAIFDKRNGNTTWYNTFGGSTLQYPVRCLVKSSSGGIWLGTDGNGLVYFDPATGESKVFTTDHGLDSNSINNVLEDNSGGIWFNTEKNLYYLDFKNKKVINMNEFLDISWGYYNPNASIKLRNGDLALGTAEGALIFSPHFDFDAEEPIELIFTDFKLLYQSVQAAASGSLLKQAINETSSIRLKYAQNSFSIAFSAIDFVYPHKIHYEYKLDHFNTDWLPADVAHSVDYMNLPPGKYTFRLKAIDKYSQKEMGERSLEIIIGRPFWASYWAFLFYFLIICVITYLSVQFARHKIKAYNSKEKIRSFISIAHDIRTPITLIKAPLSELESQEGLSEDTRKSLSVATKNAEKLFEMVTHLLDLQKADLNPERISVSLQNIYSYMEEKIADFHTAAIQKGISLKLDIEPDFPELWFDKGKMNKILDNLLSNALKYTEDGSISVIVRHTKHKWSIEILDTGIGIPAKDQKHLFNQFFRANNAVSSKETGSGIGLLLVQRIVKQLHGQISFSSAENMGSSFIITFPRQGAAARSRGGTAKFPSGIELSSCLRRSTPKGGGGGSLPQEELSENYEVIEIPEVTENQTRKNVLLLAEDDPDIREYLTEQLSKEYEVVSVSDGEKALEVAKEINPDIIISDVIMPKLEGDEMCRILKSSMETSHIPIILLTALSEREYVIAGLEAGANDYIIKPFDFSVLKVRLRNILQSRQQLRETVLSSDTDFEGIDYTNQLDKEFLDKAMEIINNELSNTEFSINDFCRVLGMSRTSVYNKLKTLTDQSPNDFIRIIRLNKSKELLASRRYTIGEVSCMVGFSDPKYFSTSFKKQFGVSPSKV